MGDGHVNSRSRIALGDFNLEKCDVCSSSRWVQTHTGIKHESGCGYEDTTNGVSLPDRSGGVGVPRVQDISLYQHFCHQLAQSSHL